MVMMMMMCEFDPIVAMDGYTAEASSSVLLPSRRSKRLPLRLRPQQARQPIASLSGFRGHRRPLARLVSLSTCQRLLTSVASTALGSKIACLCDARPTLQSLDTTMDTLWCVCRGGWTTAFMHGTGGAGSSRDGETEWHAPGGLLEGQHQTRGLIATP